VHDKHISESNASLAHSGHAGTWQQIASCSSSIHKTGGQLPAHIVETNTHRETAATTRPAPSDGEDSGATVAAVPDSASVGPKEQRGIGVEITKRARE